MTAAAGWSPRPGHQCVVLINEIVCFGGYGELPAPASPPWNGASPSDMRYDFDALVFSGGRAGVPPSIMTFGGDRERFGLPSEVNAFLVENDVWQFSR